MGFQHPLDQRAAPKASTFDNPEMTVLGSCKRIEEIMIGPETAGGFPWAVHHGTFLTLRCSAVSKRAVMVVAISQPWMLYDGKSQVTSYDIPKSSICL